MSLKTSVIGSPLAGTSVLFSILDILASVGRDCEMLHGMPPQSPAFDVSLRTADGAPYQHVNGRWITPDARLDAAPAPDLIIVPDMHFDPIGGLPDAFRPVADWIADAHARGAIVSSVCSVPCCWAGRVCLMARRPRRIGDMPRCCAAIFRKSRSAATAFSFRQAKVTGLSPPRGASAWADLMLYLIGRVAGTEDALRIAKIHLIDPRGDGQLSCASLTSARQHGDQLIARAQVWASEHYHTPGPVAAMAALTGMTELGVLRRFRKATGRAPADDVQTLRIEEARQLLETTAMSIEDISAEMGYSEPSGFRTALRKRVGLSASAYRRKWQALASGLS